jgi:hypothetical protein
VLHRASCEAEERVKKAVSVRRGKLPPSLLEMTHELPCTQKRVPLIFSKVKGQFSQLGEPRTCSWHMYDQLPGLSFSMQSPEGLDLCGDVDVSNTRPVLRMPVNRSEKCHAPSPHT